MESSIIKLENVSKHYIRDTNVVKALDGVSLTIKEGEFVVVTGPSGSGKSTLLNIIGLITTATSGTVQILGTDISRIKKGKRYKILQDVSEVFQLGNLILGFTALENVSVALAAKGMKKEMADKKSIRILRELGLGHRLHHKPDKLSGGERQRVAIARAMVVDPIILLADEPTGNVDQKMGNDILDILFKLNKEKRQTILLVTHNQEIANRIGNVIKMVDGKIVDNGER